jgi:predicted 3-demethylubiquinone-9 3-methyltransferase (glyoxalase superfamily)
VAPSRIVPHLWFDKEAKPAAELYTSLVPGSKVTNVTTLRDTPSGDCDVVSFHLSGQPFMAISAGPLFKFNPSISFHVKFQTKDEVDAMWKRLSPDGKVLMELGAYPWSERPIRAVVADPLRGERPDQPADHSGLLVRGPGVWQGRGGRELLRVGIP